MNSDPITWESLATVAGATIGAGLIVQFARTFADLSRATSRRLAAACGLIIVEGVTIADAAATGVATWHEWLTMLILGAFVGMTAGLGAAKAYEVAKDGIDHSTERRS